MAGALVASLGRAAGLAADFAAAGVLASCSVDRLLSHVVPTTLRRVRWLVVEVTGFVSWREPLSWFAGLYVASEFSRRQER